MSDLKKFDKIIPVGPKQFAYQQENIEIKQRFSIIGHLPFKGGAKEYDNREKDIISEYELEIEKFTGNSFTVTLYKKRKDIVPQRIEEGKAILRMGYQTTFDFASFVNAIFKDTEVMEFFEEEHFPQHIEEEMKKAYTTPNT